MRKLRGRYRLDELLGTGGMAVVWRGFDLVLERPVAIKLLANEVLVDRGSHQRLRAEAHSAAQLSHPNVAEVYDFGWAGHGRRRTPYIVMELVDGPTLAQLLRNGKSLHWHAATRICAQVGAALAAAHARGFVHQDVKPANIMVPSGGVKVVDFGIAVAVGSAQADQDGMLIGTPMYMAPERLLGQPAGPESDVYSLGLVMYHCLTGALPWPFETATGIIEANLSSPPPGLPALPGMPEVVAEICLRCLDKEPAGRPTSLAVATRLAEAAGVQVTAPLSARFQVPVPPRVPATPVRPRLLVEPGRAAEPGWAAEPGGTGGPGGGLSGWLVEPGWVAEPTGTGAPTGTGVPTGPEPAGIVDPAGTEPLDWQPVDAGRDARRRLRRVVITASVSAIFAIMAIPMLSGAQRRDQVGDTPSAPAQPAQLRSCTVIYLAKHERDGSFAAQLQLRNLGSQVLHGWSVGFQLPTGQLVEPSATTPWRQHGAQVSLSGSDDIAPDGELTLGLSGHYTGTPAAPEAFNLTGVDCQRVTANLQTLVLPSPTGSATLTDRSVRHSGRTPASSPTAQPQAEPSAEPSSPPATGPAPSSSGPSPEPTARPSGSPRPSRDPSPPQPSRSSWPPQLPAGFDQLRG